MSLLKKGKYWHFDFIYKGERHQGSTGQTNINKARLAESAIRSSAALESLGVAQPKLAPIFSDFMENSFMEYVWRHAKKRRTAVFYAEKMRSLLSYNPLRNVRLSEISADLIGNYCDFRSKAVGITTLNCELRTLRRALNLAFDEFKVIPAKIKVRTLPGERKREFIVSAELERQYLAAATYPLREAAILILDCGLRPEECASLRKADVKDAGGKAWPSLRGTGNTTSPSSVSVVDGKTVNAIRVLPLTQRASETIELLCALWPDSEWLFPGKMGRHYGRKSLDNLHTKLRDANPSLAGTPENHAEPGSMGGLQVTTGGARFPREFVLYSFRHTFATRLAESGASQFVIMALLGHGDIRMSARYIHPETDSLTLAMRRKEELDRIRRGEHLVTPPDSEPLAKAKP